MLRAWFRVWEPSEACRWFGHVSGLVLPFDPGIPGAGRFYTGEIRLFGEALVQAVDQVGHRLEPLGYDAQPIFAEVLRVDAERVGERLHDVVRGHRTIPVHEVVEVPRGEARPGGELPIGDPVLDHQGLDRGPEGLFAEPPAPRHQANSLPRSATANRRSSP